MFRVPRQYKDKEVLYRRVILFAVVLLMVVLYFEKILQVLLYILSICMPFLFGGGLAFVFNIIANNLMRAGNILFKIEERKIYRVIANILSIVIVLALFLGFVFLLVPQIFASLETIINNLPETLNSFYHWAYRTSSSIPSLHNWIQGLDLNVLDFDNLSNWFNDFINWIFSGGANNIFGSVYQVISTTFSIVLSTFVALMFSIIVLFNKSTVVKESKGLLRAYMPDDIYEKTLHVLRLIARTFTQYIGGTCTECIILGTLVTVEYTLCYSSRNHCWCWGSCSNVWCFDCGYYWSFICSYRIGAVSCLFYDHVYLYPTGRRKLYLPKCSWTFCWLSSNVCNRGSNSRSKFRWYLRNYNFYSCLFMYLSTCQRRCCHAFES